MKVIFLDIDGVLVTYESIKKRKETQNKTQHFCMNAVEQLNRIIKETGAKIILSSSWRIGADIAKMNIHFAENGIIETITDFTPYIKEGPPYYMEVDRHLEIKAWLTEHPEIISFVIIDDDWDARIENHYVRTDSDFGLHKRAADKAIEILLNPLQKTAKNSRFV